MFKKIHLLFVFAFALPAASYARGPFDNGDYSQFFDETGIYQVMMRFRNGIGFAQWGTNVALADPQSATGEGASGGAITKVGSPINRSVIYYKGITFVGNATGTVDHVRKVVTGITNSNSNLKISTTTAATPGLGGAEVRPGVSATTTLVDNGPTTLTANTEYTATINQTAPVLKFNGTGELSVANQSLTSQLTSALTGLIAAIPSAAISASSSTSTTGGTTVTTAPLDSILAGIGAIINNTFGPGGTTIPSTTTLQSIYDNSDVVSMHVLGSRIFQSSTR